MSILPVWLRQGSASAEPQTSTRSPIHSTTSGLWTARHPIQLGEAPGRRLTGQSLLRAERISNECNWSTARKNIGPVNRPCDRPIDVLSIASLMFLVTSRLADQRMKAHGSEARRCIGLYRLLGNSDKQDLINFQRSL